MVGGIRDERIYRPVREELSRAVACLAELAPDQRTGFAYGDNADALNAIAALNDLVQALEAVGEDTGVELPDLNAYLADPPRLRDDLRNAVAVFLRHHVAADLDRLSTFSLILFRDTDLDGAILKSLTEHRPQWRDALTPADKGEPDLHLAIIPPPSATDGISALAGELHCRRHLPCVVFLGDKPDRSLRGESILSRLSVRPLDTPPPDIPGQLRTIYRTVYSSPIAPGSLGMATADKYFRLVRERVNPKVALALIIGAIGGPACVQAFDTVSSLFMR